MTERERFEFLTDAVILYKNKRSGPMVRFGSLVLAGAFDFQAGPLYEKQAVRAAPKRNFRRFKTGFGS